jgi:adenosine deaminase
MLKYFYMTWFSVLAACGSEYKQASSDLSVDQKVALNPARSARFQDLYSKLVPLIQTSKDQAQSKVFQPSEILPFQFRANEANTINSAFPNGFTVTCHAGKCRGAGSGRKVDTTLREEREADGIAFAQHAQIYFRLYQDQRSEVIEICRIAGVQVKKSFLWADLRGGRVHYGKGSGGSPINALIDVGPFGSYPTNGCQ